MRWAPVLFLPAPIQALPLRSMFDNARRGRITASSYLFTDFRLTPHYPARSPLDDLLRQVDPGGDEYVTEKYAADIARLLGEWSDKLKTAAPALQVTPEFLHPRVATSALHVLEQRPLRSDFGIQVVCRRYGNQMVSGRDRCLQQLRSYFATIARLETAEFEIIAVDEQPGSALTVRLEIRYDFVGQTGNFGREQRVGVWRTEWQRDPASAWKILKWEFGEETVSRAAGAAFVDVTSCALGSAESYKAQMLRGTDHWRAILDGACGIDVYGTNGVAAGDIDNDGFDDLYICQPAGLPNRLYRNRGDGSFEDITDRSGVGVLDNTSCALFADFENKGLQDLLVVCGTGPLLFLNQGNGKYLLKRDAFKFARLPQGTFTHAALADYDRDGRLDVYFCVYNYYLGLDQYHYPAPYFDARNGPPNFLFHNEGNSIFIDHTEAAGLSVDNNRYSFACAWGEANSNGWPDLYVANDFGRNNLYRNNGNGTFSSVSAEAQVEDAGAGMSACWFDFDNDGNQDIYVGNMWSAAGLRISTQKRFHENEPENLRVAYRQHARGNSLYRNRGDGIFQNASRQSQVDVGRWAWSSDAWDFDHDGYPDLYIANGYITGTESRDASSFFWRQLVAKSPQTSTPSSPYEHGWNAINELIRSGASWSAPERNLFYVNNHDGTFSDVSGIVELDFPDDSRSFALADLDHDGRLEVILKNRTAPQLRILQNVMKELGGSIAFRLRGTKSNRDAIGAAITLDVSGHRQTKYLQAGSGFLSQHSKEVFFGVGKTDGPVRATIRWPSGATQVFAGLPLNHRVEIKEDGEHFTAIPFAVSSAWSEHRSAPQLPEPLPSSTETWLIEPLSAPEFSLPDLTGKVWELSLLRGSFVLLTFWTTASALSMEQMRAVRQHASQLAASGVRVLAINVDDPRDPATLEAFATTERLPFPILLATEDVAGIYNIIYRYLFDCRRDLPLPTSLLVDRGGMIVKLYQGTYNAEKVSQDVGVIPTTPAGRMGKALPFPGTLYNASFERNDFTYGVALFQRGYFEEAAASFRRVIASKPENPEAYYNLGTLELRRSAFGEARKQLEESVKLRPNYPEAWNNLGMVAAQQGNTVEAVGDFQKSLVLRPDYVVALLNLGNVYRRQQDFSQAQKLLTRAIDLEPQNAEASYSLGMLFAQQDQLPRASEYLQKAVMLRPDYADALNNLGVILIRLQHYPEAEERFRTCIQVAPKYDQAYLNLARLYVLQRNNARAREVLVALLQQQPQNQVAQQALEMLH